MKKKISEMSLSELDDFIGIVIVNTAMVVIGLLLLTLAVATVIKAI